MFDNITAYAWESVGQEEEVAGHITATVMQEEEGLVTSQLQ